MSNCWAWARSANIESAHMESTHTDIRSANFLKYSPLLACSKFLRCRSRQRSMPAVNVGRRDGRSDMAAPYQTDREVPKDLVRTDGIADARSAPHNLPRRHLH